MNEWTDFKGTDGYAPSEVAGRAIQIKLRDGTETVYGYADSYEWAIDGSDGDIVQYRVLTAETNTNPKMLVGSKALPMSLLSPVTIAYGCLGKLNGKEKYGLSNYIGTQVVMSIYIDAIKRHLAKIELGEEYDEADGVPHWGAIIANIDIIVSAQLAKTLIDDRMLSVGQLEELKRITPLVASLQELHKDKDPVHYYLKEKK